MHLALGMLNVKAIPLLMSLLILTTGFTAAKTSSLEKCLDDQPNEIQMCLKKTSKHITLSSCYEQSRNVRSNYLKENVMVYCFYHISEFPNLSSCVTKARQFSDAENHDAALFNCYSQFEERINKSTCERMAKFFRFPEKGRYLKSNCHNLD